MISGLTQWVKNPAYCELWCRLLAAVTPIQPLAWELPFATGVALKSKKKKKKKKKKKERKRKKKKKVADLSMQLNR